VLRASPRFPELFVNLYTSGEISGKLDETLRRLRDYFQEEGSRRMQLLAQMIPRVIYLAVAIAIAGFIIKFYLGYFSEIQKAGGF
jgi:type II secretory pathway component PulF